jgi:DNA-binding MarR family transcriptional regulator
MDDFLQFRTSVQKFVRTFNIGNKKTPCGNNISPHAAHILMLILKENNVSQSLLVDELSLDKSNVTRLCISLEKKGFLDRVPSLDDRRALQLNLTNKGKKLAKELKKDSMVFLSNIFKSVPPKKHKEINKTLELLSEACIKVRSK